MQGLSTTAIGGPRRNTDTSLSIYRELKTALSLEFLELAIGVYAQSEDVLEVPLVLHDSCLYDDLKRLLLSPLNPEGWKAYRDYIQRNKVLAVSLHPPKLRECSKTELIVALSQMEDYFGVPVLLEVMPSPEWWHSMDTLLKVPTLLDVSHTNIWCKGDRRETKEITLRLLDGGWIKGIHLSHNEGKSDSHDMVPPNVWWREYLESWSDYLVTWESLPIEFAQWERTDRNRKLNRQR